jgi:hypothetical protein
MSSTVAKARWPALGLAAAAVAVLYDCAGWDCTDCSVPAECVASCPPDQEFDGCFCIGGEAGADPSADADGRTDPE